MTVAEKGSKVSQPRDYQLIVEKDVAVPMRDGTVIYADVFRPDCEEKVPAIMNLSVYQKDKLWVPPEDLEEKPAMLNRDPYLAWMSRGIPTAWEAEVAMLIDGAAYRDHVRRLEPAAEFQ